MPPEQDTGLLRDTGLVSETGLLSRVDLRGADADIAALLPAPELGDHHEVGDVVRRTIEEVRSGGDAALRALTERLDGVRVGDLRVSGRDLDLALGEIPGPLRDALELAHANITAYHREQLRPEIRHERAGVAVTEMRRPVASAGLYVPGGTAALASTVLMTAVPARVAGVARVVVCTPPAPDGSVPAATRAAARLAGVDELYRVGGAQAIAAMAYGTETIGRVDVIAGPGNRYVALAERAVAAAGVVGVPSAFTGPSEVAVVADASTPAAFAAVDLVVQAEHGPGGRAYLITWDEAVAERIASEVERLCDSSPRREHVRATLGSGGFCVLVDGPERAMEVANWVAPEHLEIMCERAASLVPLVLNAGAVFVGPWSPASVGDYLAGPNHVLPTARSARFASALRVDDFCRSVHVVEVGASAIGRLTPHVEALACSEGLAEHARSVRLRAQRLEDDGSG